jgi:hypothetical protein
MERVYRGTGFPTPCASKSLNNSRGPATLASATLPVPLAIRKFINRNNQHHVRAFRPTALMKKMDRVLPLRMREHFGMLHGEASPVREPKREWDEGPRGVKLVDVFEPHYDSPIEPCTRESRGSFPLSTFLFALCVPRASA